MHAHARANACACMCQCMRMHCLSCCAACVPIRSAHCHAPTAQDASRVSTPLFQRVLSCSATSCGRSLHCMLGPDAGETRAHTRSTGPAPSLLPHRVSAALPVRSADSFGSRCKPLVRAAPPCAAGTCAACHNITASEGAYALCEAHRVRVNIEQRRSEVL